MLSRGVRLVEEDAAPAGGGPISRPAAEMSRIDGAWALTGVSCRPQPRHAEERRSEARLGGSAAGPLLSMTRLRSSLTRCAESASAGACWPAAPSSSPDIPSATHSRRRAWRGRRRSVPPRSPRDSRPIDPGASPR